MTVSAHASSRFSLVPLGGVCRVWAAVAIAILIAGCATSINSLTPAEIATVRIESIDVRFAPTAHIWWGNAEREYAEKAGAAPASEAPARTASSGKDQAKEKQDDSPEVQAYMRNKLSAMITERMHQVLQPKFRGTRAARLEVEVHSFFIPSPVQRVLLGGAPVMAAVTVLRDATTGKELARLDQGSGAYAGQGILGVAVDQAFSDLEDRVLQNYVDNVLSWLKVA